LKTFVKNRQTIWLHFGSDLLKMDPIFKIFTRALTLLTYSQQPGAKSGLISPTVSEICSMVHLTHRKKGKFLKTSSPSHVNFWGLKFYLYTGSVVHYPQEKFSCPHFL